MPLWAWILVDLSVLVIGAGWLAYLIWNLTQRGAAIAKVTKPLTQQLEALTAAQENLNSAQRKP